MKSLKAFLAQKGKEYAPFDTQRVHRIYALLEPHLEKLYKQSRESQQNSPFIIHILGTNGKGSTGRFITLGLAQNGYKVLHFTSPHLFDFNERFYMANMQSCADLVDCADCGAKSSAEAKITDCRTQDSNQHRIATHSELESAHLWLQRFPIVRESSYFEYATFLALYLAKDCDYFVCEAGLGGEFDSTSVLNADLSIFTPIGLDHEEFLGSDIASIAGSKLRAMGKNVLLAPQRFTQCKKIAKQIAQEKNAHLFTIPNLHKIIISDQSNNSNAQKFNQYAQKFSKTFHCENMQPLDSIFWRDFAQYIAKNTYPQFLQENLFCAIFALLFWNLRFDFTTLKTLDLRGRCEILAPNILLDVGHNIECAKVLKHTIVQKFGKKNIILVYNAYFDKAISAILSILKPVVSEVLILKVKNDRIIKKAELEEILHNLGLKYSDFTPAKLHKDNNYVVFGSFSVVAEFLTKSG
ncbi:bifunctional folylpolyglutamate synthase/dihydrofolate synthase [Helicobacter sp. 23-1046]